MANSKSTPIAIELIALGHEFVANKPVFIGMDAQIKPGFQAVINGANGSGKSTLGKILAGQMTATNGEIIWKQGARSIIQESVVLNASFVGPATTLHPHMSILEIIAFHGTFRPWREDVSPQNLLDSCGLASHMHVRFAELSSGMQQRVLLTVSLATDSALVILDEPCANLDRTGIEWYQQRLSEFPDDATLIICTNDRKEDYSKADIMINL